MQPEDIGRLVVPEDPRVHSGRVVYVRSKVDLEEDRYHRSLWILENGEHRQITKGPGDSSPRWSPDGRLLAFLRSDGEAKPQVALVELSDGEPRTITEFDLGVEEIEWSPNGNELAVIAVEWLEPDIDEAEREQRPRRIASIAYRYDGKGWLADRRRRIYLVSLEGVCRALTDGAFDESEIAWSPDASRVAFLSDRHPRQALELGINAWEIDVESGAMALAVPQRGMWRVPSYRPDGLLHLLGRPEARWPTTAHIYRRELDGSLSDLSLDLDRSPISLAAGPARVAWEGHTMITGVEDAGTFGVLSVGPDGSAQRLVGDERVVTGFDVEGERIVSTSSTTLSPGELHDGGLAVTSLSPGLGLTGPEHFRVVSDGVEIDAWVHLPEGDHRVPGLLNIHGGPSSQYGFGFLDEFAVYSGAGYGVIACNPRGSSGRGEEFARAVTGEGWGVVDMADIMAVLDEALRRFPRIDENRLGIMGGSYGGFMTAWITARDHRFKSAIVERGLLSWTSFAGTSDIGANFGASYLSKGESPGWDLMWRQSPLATAEKVRTPTLVIHSEEDWRCPIEQAEQYFAVLLAGGVETEMLRFPGEGHEMSRSGKPRHRVERFQAILDWHRRWLS